MMDTWIQAGNYTELVAGNQNFRRKHLWEPAYGQRMGRLLSYVL